MGSPHLKRPLPKRHSALWRRAHGRRRLSVDDVRPRAPACSLRAADKRARGRSCRHSRWCRRRRARARQRGQIERVASGVALRRGQRLSDRLKPLALLALLVCARALDASAKPLLMLLQQRVQLLQLIGGRGWRERHTARAGRRGERRGVATARQRPARLIAGWRRANAHGCARATRGATGSATETVIATARVLRPLGVAAHCAGAGVPVLVLLPAEPFRLPFASRARRACHGCRGHG